MSNDVALKTVLAVSVLFNVFFLGGYVLAPHFPPPMRGGPHRGFGPQMMLDRLDIEPAEREALEQLMRPQPPDGEKSVMQPEAARAALNRMWRELLKDEPSEAVMRECVSAMSASQAEMILSVHHRLAAYLKTLPKDRRTKIVEEFLRNGPPPHP